MASFSTAEIATKYEQVAGYYDRSEGPLEWLLGVRRLRRDLLRRASGETLEVAAGTGSNFRWYPRSVQLTAVDVSPKMMAIARKRAHGARLDVTFLMMDAEALAFGDGSFDTVVSSLSLCTFPDPVAAVWEMTRVCRPGGRILLLEHGLSDRRRVARWQNRRANRHAQSLGCYWNREPLDIVRQAGLTVIDNRRHLIGMFHLIEAARDSPAPAVSEA